MKNKYLFVLILCYQFLVGNFLSASNSGASFLNIGTSARAISMGGAYVGVADDANAISYNPAGLSQLNRNEITAQHTEWISDVKHDFLAGAFPLRNSTVGFSVIYLSQGKLEGRDEDRNKTDSFSAYDVATTISYAKSINDKVKFGTNLKLIQQKIETEHATGVAVDIGTLYNTAIKNLTLGFSFRNLGPKMTFISEGYNLPLTATVGFGYTLKRAITLAFDVKRKIIDNKTEVSFGTEYTPINILALRVGYLKSLNPEDISKLSDFKGLGGGLGLRILNFSTDYAFVPYGDLGNTHRVSFSIKF
ncbi:MAG: PorV/PorQ family protein [Elusimicrobia bacterium]|nr:PorV/PorQ family protein [Elusimicrobiota bacterium]